MRYHKGMIKRGISFFITTSMLLSCVPVFAEDNVDLSKVADEAMSDEIQKAEEPDLATDNEKIVACTESDDCAAEEHKENCPKADKHDENQNAIADNMMEDILGEEDTHHIVNEISTFVNTRETTASGTCGENLTWVFDESTGTLTISGTGDMVDYKNSINDYDHAPWWGFDNMKYASIGNGVTSIGNSAFFYCKNLSSIEIPNSVTSIGESAFHGCSSLSSIEIPNSVTSIGNSAFYGCSSLSSIEIPDSVTAIDDLAFADCSSLSSIEIPDSVTMILGSAFYGCSSLSSIEIPDSVTAIDDLAFAGCSSLSSIEIPHGVTYIGKRAFDCKMIVDEQNMHYLSKEGVLFNKNLTEIVMYPRNDKDTHYIIPATVNVISRSAFENCVNLISIEIPDGVISIDISAFYNCSNLKDVYYSGSESDWNNISINGHNNCLTDATIHYNSTGPDEPADPSVHVGKSVVFLSKWDSATHQVFFDYSETEISPVVYTVADGVDISNIDSLVNRYVLTTAEQGGSVLEYTVTDIRPVESKIGTVSATGEHSLTIDGSTYPVREDFLLASLDGKKILYHVSNGTIMGFDVLEEKHGVLGSWNDATKKITIGGTEYPTNYLTDLSFMDNIRDYFQKDITFLVADSSGYCPMIEVTGLYSPSGNVNGFNADVYHANWLSQDTISAIKLNEKTPSDILSEQLTNRGMESATVMWKSLQVIFDTIEDPTSIKDFAFEKKDMYSAIILDALESSVSYDAIDSFFEDYYDQLGDLSETVSKAIQLQHNIDITKPGEFVKMTSQQRADVQKETKKWFEKELPELTITNSIFDGISMGFDSIESLENYGERIASTLLLANTNESMKAVIRQAYQNSRSTNNIDLQLALKDCVQIMDASTEELCQRLVAGEVTVLGGKALKYLIKEQFWSEVTETLNQVAPEIAMLKAVYKVESFLCDRLTHASSAIEQYLKMLSILDIESLMNGVYNDLRQSFLKEKDSQQALVYLEAMRLMFKLRSEDCESAVDYVDVIYTEDVDIFDDSLLLMIKRLFGAKDTDDIQALKKSIQNIQSYYNDVYIDTEKGWIYWLENDFPGTGLYEKYLKFYESGGNVSLVKEYKAACPVDVYVYDQLNNVVASVIDGRVSCSVDDVMIALVDDQKIIRFYDGADYRIEYAGYDAGDMDVTITEFGKNEKMMRTVNYYNLALVNGKTYTIDANDDTLKPYNLVDKTNNSTVQHDYDSMDTNAAHTIKIISGTLQQSGELFAETTASKGETLQLNAYVPEGYEFIRWESSSANALIADINSVNTILIMPDEDLIVTAIMRETQNPSKDHIVTLNPNGGTISVNTVTTDANGKLSSLPMPTRSGYTFNGWFTAVSGGEKITTDYVFTSDTTVYAHWTKNDGNSSGGSSSGGKNHNSSNSVTTGDFAHGSINVSPQNASKGTNVTLTIQPDHGYALDSLVVKDAKGNSVELTKETDTKYTFIMPDSKATIDATFKKIEQQPSGKIDFIDVLSNAYYFDAVQWAVKQGITAGTSNIMFSPDAPCTRAQIITFLWRAAGSPLVDGNNLFIDVPHDSYYYNAVQWAVAKGIAVGTSAKTFSPDATCTRGQAMTFLYRYEKTPVVSGSNLFTDVDNNKYYANAVQWAAKKGITAGTSAKTFHPNATCTRAQIVTFLYRNMA